MAVGSSPGHPGCVTHPRSDAALLATTLLAITASILPAFLTGAVAVQLRRDLEFGEAGLGLAFAVFFASAAAASIVGGRLTQRLGAAVALRAGVSVAAVVNVIIALQARSLTTLCVLLGVAGLGNAISQPAANLIIADHPPKDRLGFAIGLKQSGMPLATLLGGLAVPVLAQTLGWEAAYIAAAVIAVIGAVLVSGERTPASSPGPRQKPETPVRMLAFLGFGMFFGAGAAGALSSFLVSSAEASGLSTGQAGVLLAFGSACGITVRVSMGAHADRHPGHHLRTVSAMLALGAAAFVILAIHGSVSSIIGTPLAFATGWAWPGLFNLAVVRANPRAAGSATGITQTGVYLGALSGPLVFGVVVDQAGYSTAWLVITGAALAAAAVFFVADRFLEPAAPKSSARTIAQR